jgi:hypothetical protein
LCDPDPDPDPDSDPNLGALYAIKNRYAYLKTILPGLLALRRLSFIFLLFQNSVKAKLCSSYFTNHILHLPLALPSFSARFLKYRRMFRKIAREMMIANAIAVLMRKGSGIRSCRANE